MKGKDKQKKNMDAILPCHISGTPFSLPAKRNYENYTNPKETTVICCLTFFGDRKSIMLKSQQ